MLKRCSNCVITETHETISFDEKGVCNVCNNHKYKHEKVDWNKRQKELKEILDVYRNKGQYDCLIPFSGGKDSTFTLWYLITQHKLKPLVISFDHGFYRPKVLAYRERTFRRLGCDFISFRANPKIVKKTMLESLKRKGDFCWHCHTGIFAYPMQIAVKFKIPLIIWGEQNSEYTAYYSYEEKQEVDERMFNLMVNLGITAEDMAGFIPGITLRDLEPFRYPALKDLRAIKYSSICLGTYIPWDVKKQAAIIKKELNWQGDIVEGVPAEYSYEKIECAFQGVRDYCKFVKRGYARIAHLTSLDIRNNRMSREKAMELVKEEGKRPASLDIFLKYVGIAEDEFNKILLAQKITPYEHDFSKTEKGEPLPDMKNWHLID